MENKDIQRYLENWRDERNSAAIVSVSVNGVNSLCGIFKVQGCQ